MFMVRDDYSDEAGDVDWRNYVTAGAEWLDQVYPGWERKVDLGVLQMASSCDCILGQVAGNTLVISTVFPFRYQGVSGFSWFYDIATVVYGSGGASSWMIEHGFNTLSEHQFHVLREAWLRELKERFDSGELSDREMS